MTTFLCCRQTCQLDLCILHLDQAPAARRWGGWAPGTRAIAPADSRRQQNVTRTNSIGRRGQGSQHRLVLTSSLVHLTKYAPCIGPGTGNERRGRERSCSPSHNDIVLKTPSCLCQRLPTRRSVTRSNILIITNICSDQNPDWVQWEVWVQRSLSPWTAWGRNHASTLTASSFRASQLVFIYIAGSFVLFTLIK